MNTLYILQGSKVAGDAAMSILEDQDLDTTRLWHMRLGHMSKRGLHVLSKQVLLCGQKTRKLDFCVLAQGYNHPFLVCFDDYKTY